MLTAEALERWSVGALERWSVGALERWSVDIPVRHSSRLAIQKQPALDSLACFNTL